MSGIFKPLPGAQLNLDHPLARGLVGCWLMNEGSGNKVHDYSGQNNTGTCINMNDPPISTSGWVPGPHGGALAFDGVNDYVGLGNPISLQLSNFTIVINYRQKSVPVSYPNLVGHGTNGWAFGLSNDGINVGKVFIAKSGAAPYLNSNTVLSNGADYFLAVAVSGITSNLFVNGLLETTSNSTPAFTFVNGLSIGRDNGGGGIINGLISSASIYNRALSAEEIAYLYAFPYCMFDDAGWEAWMASNNIPKFMNYYRQMRAA